MELSMEGTIILAQTQTPYDKQLQEFSHINISSAHPWDPIKVHFPTFSWSLEEEVVGVQYISDVVASQPEEDDDDEYCVFI